MIYLDTHVVVWLYIGQTSRFAPALQRQMNQHAWLVSPIVRLELQFLHEIGRLQVEPVSVIDDLRARVGLSICGKPFDRIVSSALSHGWTRDPFDRIVVAHAAVDDNLLVSADQTIRQNYRYTLWE